MKDVATPEAIASELMGTNPPYVADPEQLMAKAPPRSVRMAAVEAKPEDVDQAAIPKTLDDLSAQEIRSYDLTVTRAADLSIPVVGSVGGGMNRRVVVLERIAYKPIVGTSGTECHYGYAIRLCVTVNKWDANMKVSLPFLAASAQMGQVQASWMMQVLGLAGQKITEVAVPPTELNVETFVLAKQSLVALIAAVNDATTKFAPYLLVKILPDARRIEELRRAVASAYALTRIARRASLSDTLNRLGSDDAIMNAGVEDTYGAVADASLDARPSEEAARKSRDILGRVDADV